MDFTLSFTNKEITPWGGMVFLKQMLDKKPSKMSLIPALVYLPKIQIEDMILMCL